MELLGEGFAQSGVAWDGLAGAAHGGNLHQSPLGTSSLAQQPRAVSLATSRLANPRYLQLSLLLSLCGWTSDGTTQISALGAGNGSSTMQGRAAPI